MLYILLFILLIAVFITGMTILRAGLFQLSGETFKRLLERVTSSPFKAMLTSILVTAVLHSSSAVMVITIGLIAAGMLNFSKSIGIILGTNIGTTFTTEIITFNINQYLIPMTIIGAVLMLFRNQKLRSSGSILFGMSAVFIAIRGFEFLATPLTKLDAVGSILAMLNESHLLSIGFGTIFTALIQSSTAMTGITMGFLSGGILKIDSGIAIMLGSNIGTCITGYLASIGSGHESKLCAYAHIWLNVVGVALFIPLIDWMAALSPLAADSADVQLAHSSLLFNVLTSLIVLPFAEQFGRWIEYVHGRRA
ncbi:Na/Pi symporter [Bacillus marasmi]|uniref:Na/Pi symporter n=1 Tax=Bacillus marasmi TaxID=1926279 RepID=UPI0011C97DCE|nr:Na/Pi symporter [Bacillus marasmi]